MRVSSKTRLASKIARRNGKPTLRDLCKEWQINQHQLKIDGLRASTDAKVGAACRRQEAKARQLLDMMEVTPASDLSELRLLLHILRDEMNDEVMSFEGVNERLLSVAIDSALALELKADRARFAEQDAKRLAA